MVVKGMDPEKNEIQSVFHTDPDFFLHSQLAYLAGLDTV